MFAYRKAAGFFGFFSSSNQALFSNIVESAPNAIVLVDQDGRITLVNAQTEKLFDYPRTELLGQPIERLVPERFRAAHPAHRMAFFASPSMRSMGAGRDLFGLHKEGREFPIEIGLTPIQDDTGAMVLASIIDITERKRAEQGIRLLMKQIQETSGVLTASTSEILETASQVAAGSAETASAVSQTTSTVEEIKQTAQVATEKSQHVSDTAQRAASISQDGRQAVQESIEAMQHIQKQMESIAENIIRLSEQGQAIGEIIATVNDLAAQSKQATAQVRSILGDIQKATSKAVMSTEQDSKAVDSGVKLSQRVEEAITVLSNSVEEAAQAAMQIAVSARQQLVGLDQAVLAIRSISQASQLNTESARKSETVAHKLHELSLTLKNMLEQGER